MIHNTTIDREGRKVIFDSIADDYNSVRPGYPPELINRIIPTVEQGDLLESGCGSGQATRQLTGRGYAITAIDISPELLAIARHNLARSRVNFIQTSFEEFSAPPGSFDIILAASSWHWIDPAVGFAKATELLRPSGRLINLIHLHPPTPGFFPSIQSIYEEVVPEWGVASRTRPIEEGIEKTVREWRESGYFAEIEVEEERWEMEYSRERFLQLLGTYSDHRLLPPAQFEELKRKIGQVIDAEYDGVVVRPYCSVAFVGVRNWE